MTIVDSDILIDFLNGKAPKNVEDALDREDREAGRDG